MCGIAGIWSKTGNSVSVDRLKGMLSNLARRGPDAEGVWHNPHLALGHRRLKVIDLSDAANQPFSDGADVLVFNGEIFNYGELKKELSPRFNFSTHSDTEVLFRGLQVWGLEALKKIEGQFAFAFYRSSANTLLLARDHAGICPLYIRETEDELCFSSTITPLLSNSNTRLDKQGVVDYFFYRYNIQNGRTLFDGIRRFPPAHYLEISLTSKQRSEKRFWSLTFTQQGLPHAKVQERFNALFDSEVARQQVADVPVGLFLSGGIDSGALLAGFAKAHTDIQAFTLDFSERDSDSARVTELAARYRFTSHRIKFESAGFSALEDTLASLEEPFGDLIICANYSLAQEASRELKVVLSGEGGDEALCGYDHQRVFMKMACLAQHPALHTAAAILLRLCPASFMALRNPYPGRFTNEECARIKDTFSDMRDPLSAYIRLVSLFGKDDLTDLLSEDFKKESLCIPDTLPLRDIFASHDTLWQKVMRAEIEQLTLIVNLLKQDRFTMRFSLEGRVPLASKRVLEFAASLPYNEIFGPVNKGLLLNYAGRLPVKKRPFSILVDTQYAQAILNLWDRHVTEDAVREGNILSWDAVKGLRARLAQGGMLAAKKSMAVLVFVVWFKVFKKYLK